MYADIISWSRSKGLFAGIVLVGAILRQEHDDNSTLYGKNMENREIVTEGIRGGAGVAGGPAKAWQAESEAPAPTVILSNAPSLSCFALY
jgi:hypothetical protein